MVSGQSVGNSGRCALIGCLSFWAIVVTRIFCVFLQKCLYYKYRLVRITQTHAYNLLHKLSINPIQSGNGFLIGRFSLSFKEPRNIHPTLTMYHLMCFKLSIIIISLIIIIIIIYYYEVWFQVLRITLMCPIGSIGSPINV